MAVHLEKCCCCISLRTACLIFGYIGVINSAIGTVALFIVTNLYISEGIEPEKKFEHSKNSTDTDLEEFQKLVSLFGGCFLLIPLFLFALAFGFYLVLLVGIHQNKLGHVKNWTEYKVVFLFLQFVLTFAFWVVCYNDEVHIDPRINLALIIAFFWNCYMWAVVRSYYHQERKSEVSWMTHNFDTPYQRIGS